jgi:hypothetical protein
MADPVRYAGGGGDVPDALREWVNAGDPETARGIFVRSEAALRSPEAAPYVEATMEQTRDPLMRHIVQARFGLLERCLREGVDAALAGLPAAHELLRAFLEADSYNRQLLMVLDEPTLLGEDVDALLSFLAVIQGDPETEGYLLDSWRILEIARTDVDVAFADRIQRGPTIVPPDVADRFVGDPDPASRERVIRAYPALRALLEGRSEPEAQLRERFDALIGDLPDEGASATDRPGR